MLPLEGKETLSFFFLLISTVLFLVISSKIWNLWKVIVISKLDRNASSQTNSIDGKVRLQLWFLTVSAELFV